jgi:hypothetical protein
MNVHNKNTNIKYKLNFKTMKKGLLTVLLASLVLVGCQNYDDQFDDLNAQISALKSQVDGLASLSGQVSSLSGTISGLQAGISAAQAAATAAGASADAATAAANAIDLTSLSAGLTTLQAEVDAVQASLATAATASAVAALQSELDAIEADVDELLSTSNIYSTDVSVNSVSTLDAALALGNKLNVLNASATITVSTAMDQTKVQTLVDRIKTMTGNMVFNSSSTTETTFEKLTSVSGLYVNQKGGYNFKNLISADAVQLNDQYEANIGIIDFRSLTTVTSFATTDSADSDTANTIDFNQATELHLTSMARYPNSSLTIVTKEGATLAMPVLDDKDNNGLYEATSLTLTGPASFSTSLLDDGALSFTNVATVSVTDYRGTIGVNTGVETFTGTDIAFLTVDAGADDLTSITADFKRDDADNLTTTETAALEYDASGGNNGDLSLTGLANLTSATISGDAGDITISTNPNLSSVTVSANAFDFTMNDNDNLTSVNVTGAKFHDVSITGMADLTSLTLNHTTKLPSTSSTAAEKGASLDVNTNASLASLTVSADDIDALSVYTNAVLATVDFTGLTDDGSNTVTSAAVYNNNLAVQLFKNGYDSGTSYVANTATDTGAITSDSGIATLKTWLDNVMSAASATAGIYVFVDQIDKYEVQSSLNGVYTDTAVPTAPSVTTEATANSNSTSIYAVVAKQGAEVAADTGAARNETMTQTFAVTNNALYAAQTQLTTNEGFAINVAGLSKSFMVGDTYSGAANGSTVQTVADMIAYINADTAWDAASIDITVSNNGFLRSLQEIQYTDDAGAALTVSAAGTIWYKLGSTTASGATAALTAGGGASNIATQVAAKIEAHRHPVTGAALYNAVANGAVVEITQAVSVSGYANDVTAAASIPTISFVIDAAQTSTTAELGDADAAGESNTVLEGAAKGFNLNVNKQDVNGVTFKMVSTNNNVARFAGDRVLHLPGATSATIGVAGKAGSASQTLQHGTTSATLVSGTHFLVTDANGVNDYATTFAQISSVTAGATTQAAAVTDRTGWL